MEELKDNIRKMSAMLKELGMEKVTDDMLLDCCVRMLNTSKINGKSNTVQAALPEAVKMASDKQKSFLKSLGYKGDPAGLTSQQASAEIEKLKK